MKSCSNSQTQFYSGVLSRVIRNDCRGFDKLSYKTNLRYRYVVVPMNLEILSVFLFIMCDVQ